MAANACSPTSTTWYGPLVVVCSAASASSARCWPRDAPSRPPSAMMPAASAAMARDDLAGVQRRPDSDRRAPLRRRRLLDEHRRGVRHLPGRLRLVRLSDGLRRLQPQHGRRLRDQRSTRRPTAAAAATSASRSAAPTPACSSGTAYVCKPTCDATHADCNLMPDDGCEVDLERPRQLRRVRPRLHQPERHDVVHDAGRRLDFCNPTCTPPLRRLRRRQDQRLHDQPRQRSRPTAAHCGRGCSTATHDLDGVHQRPVQADLRGAVQRLLALRAAPGADNGCETNGTADPGENDNACGGQRQHDHRGQHHDRDVEPHPAVGRHSTPSTCTCPRARTSASPGTSQSYTALVAADARRRAPTSASTTTLDACDNTWKNDLGTAICVTWCGELRRQRRPRLVLPGLRRRRRQHLRQSYTLTITYASEGSAPPGCTKPSC